MRSATSLRRWLQRQWCSPWSPNGSRDLGVIEVADEHLVVALFAEPDVSAREESRISRAKIFFHQMGILGGVVPACSAFDAAALGHVLRRCETIKRLPVKNIVRNRDQHFGAVVRINHFVFEM